MFEINTFDLKKEIDKLNTLIDEYEQNQLNMFHQLKDSCINWQDGNSIEFENKIYLEKKEYNLFLQSLKQKTNIYQFLYNKYNELGAEIICNLNSKESILYVIDNCESKLISLINDFKNIDNTFYYPEYNTIMTQNNQILTIKNNLLELKNSIKNFFDNIEKIEKEVKIKIKELDEIKINTFDFTLHTNLNN